MKVALYARVSLPSKEKDPITKESKYRQETENQLIPLRKYVVSREWEIAKEYVDRQTGSIADRKAFEDLMKDAAQHQFDAVLFWSLDRFSREGVLETLTHLKVLTQYGVDWKSYTEQFLDSIGPFREAILAVLACIAKQERIRIQERVKAGMERARLQGKHLGRRRTIFNKEKLVEDRKSGMSLSQIAKKHKIPRPSVARYLKELMKCT